jgi:hypothetical protein
MINKENIYKYLYSTDFINLHYPSFQILNIYQSVYLIDVSYTYVLGGQKYKRTTVIFNNEFNRWFKEKRKQKLNIISEL